MDAGYGSGNGRLTGSQLRALAAAQTRRVRAVGIVVPVAVGACIAAVGACWVLAAGAMAATHAMLAFTQTLRGAIVLAAAAVGALVMFVPLEALGLVYRDIGWAGAITPVGGATLMVLAAYAAAALAGSSRSAALVIVAVWLFFALVWDPNVPQLVLQRGLPLLVLCLLCACVWRALGASEYAWRKLGGAR